MEKIDLKDKIKLKLHENYSENNFISEEGSEEKEENPNEEKASGKYQRVQALLKNDIINHAAVERAAFGSSDGTSRSLFRKKLHRMTDDNGGTYAFTDDEVSKILSVIQNLGASINKSVKKKDKE